MTSGLPQQPAIASRVGRLVERAIAFAVDERDDDLAVARLAWLARDDQAALGGGRHGELADHQRLAKPFQDHCTATHARPFPISEVGRVGRTVRHGPGGRVTRGV